MQSPDKVNVLAEATNKVSPIPITISKTEEGKSHKYFLHYNIFSFHNF